MFDYLLPYDGPVVEGLEKQEVVYAATQSEYIPLRALVATDKMRGVISRWTLNEKQRAEVAAGADIFLELSTFGGDLQPIRIAVSDGLLDPDWVRVCLLHQHAAFKAGQNLNGSRSE